MITGYRELQCLIVPGLSIPAELGENSLGSRRVLPALGVPSPSTQTQPGTSQNSVEQGAFPGWWSWECPHGERDKDLAWQLDHRWRFAPAWHRQLPSAPIPKCRETFTSKEGEVVHQIKPLRLFQTEQLPSLLCNEGLLLWFAEIFFPFVSAPRNILAGCASHFPEDFLKTPGNRTLLPGVTFLSEDPGRKETRRTPGIQTSLVSCSTQPSKNFCWQRSSQS